MSRKRRGASLALVALALTAALAPLDASARRSGKGLPPACRSLGTNPHVRATPGSAPSLAGYAVFTRSQTPQDIPSFGLTGNTGQLASYDPRATRLAQASGPRHLYLLRGHRIHLRVSAGCLDHLPARVRPAVRLLARDNAGQPGVCVLEQTAGAGPGAQSDVFDTTCVTPRRFSTGFGFVGLTGHGSKTVLAEVVPDGVAAVEMRYASGAVFRGTVTSNLTTLARPAALDRQLLNPGQLTKPRQVRRLVLAATPVQVIWRDAQGHVVRSFLRTRAIINDELSGAVLTAQILK